MSRWLKRIAIALSAIVAVLSSFVAIVYFFGSDGARDSLGFLYVAIIANHHPPPIAESGVISDGPNWMMPEPAATRFTAILRKTFPRGTDERTMQSALIGQGFQEDDSGHEKALKYEWGGVPCNSWLAVHWTVDRSNRIASIKGDYSAACL